MTSRGDRVQRYTDALASVAGNDPAELLEECHAMCTAAAYAASHVNGIEQTAVMLHALRAVAAGVEMASDAKALMDEAGGDI